MKDDSWDTEVDVLVVGSGNGGMTAAVCAYEMGCRDVLLIEKGDKFGGTAATSGGCIWIPCNRHARELGEQDSVAEAHDYVRRTVPDDIRRDDMVSTYLENGPKMINFLHEHTHARYMSLMMPDYHSHLEGAKGSRVLEPQPFNSALLGADNDIIHRATFSLHIAGLIPASCTEFGILKARLPGWQWTVAKLILGYVFDLPWRLRSKYGRHRKCGSAGVSRLYLSLKERAVPMWRNTAMRELIESDDRIIGAVVEREGKTLRIRARKGVILCAGGFEQDQKMRERYLPSPTNRNWSTGVTTNTGDAINAGIKAGGATSLMDRAWWCMTSNVPGEEVPRLVLYEKALPGCCLVGPGGQRFLNESQNYQSLVSKLYEAHSNTHPVLPCWLIFDARYRRDYIVGPLLTPIFKPDWTFPRRWYDEGFIAKASTIEELARKINVDVAGLRNTVDKMNGYAKTGRDLEFGRGDAPYDRFYGDPTITPNPNLAPITEAPFYAIRLNPGDIGTQGGLVTNTRGQVLREDGTPVAGLYASGNCTAAVLPTYPGGGSTLGPAMVFAYQAAKDIAGFKD